MRVPYVRHIRDGVYEVAGLVELGDSKPSYVVDVVAGTCTCQFSTWGRRRKLCTHLAAAMLVHKYGGGTMRAAVTVVEGCSVEVPRWVEAVCRPVKRVGCLGDVGTRCILVARIDEPTSIVVRIDGRDVALRLVPEHVPVAVIELVKRLGRG